MSLRRRWKHDRQRPDKRWQRLALMVQRLERLLAANARLDAHMDPRGHVRGADSQTDRTVQSIDIGMLRLEARIAQEMDLLTAALLRADLERRQRAALETPKVLAARVRARRRLTRLADERDDKKEAGNETAAA